MEVILIMAVVWGILCGYIATEKGRGGFGWFVAGFFFGLFALVAIIAVPSHKKE